MLTQEYLKSILRYDPETGLFTWIVTFSNRCKTGQLAGGLQNHGYWRIRINKKDYQAHRLAWLYMIGEWPKSDIDHINTIKSDNRWCNLREATEIQNAHNRSYQINNKLGVKGVSIHKPTGKFIAYIKLNQRQKNLGLFETLEEAKMAYDKAAEAQGDFKYGI